MTKYRLLWRSVQYYWKTILLVTIGIIIGTTVVTGSMIIGKSVPQSLLDNAMARIGNIDYALRSTKLFTRKFVENIEKKYPNNQFASALMLSGVTKHSQMTIPQVNILGVDDKFATFYEQKLNLKKREVAINESLAKDLGIKINQRLLLYIYRSSFVPTETLFARKNFEDNVYTLRVKVVAILPDQGMGGFRLDANPQMPRNVFVSQDYLAKQLERQNYINTLLVSGDPIKDVREHLSCEDLGIYFRLEKDERFIQSKNFVFHDYELSGIQKALEKLQEKARLASVYVVNKIQNGEEVAAYAMIGGVEGLEIPEGEVFVNRWLAEDLKLNGNNEVEFEYFIPSVSGRLVTKTLTLKVTKKIAMNNSVVSSKLIPEFEGLTNADNIRDWNVPFEVDLSTVSDRDEEYWELYRAAPKAFVSTELLRKMWDYRENGQVDWVSTVIVSNNIDMNSLQKNIVENANLNFYGLRFLPVRKQIEFTSSGATDFGGLFIALNFFILLAALLLIAMLTKLQTTSRASQMGIMSACGFSHKSIRSLFLYEGFLCCVVGASIGVLTGVVYARYIVTLLTTSWIGATGTNLLQIHLNGGSLVGGGVIGLVVSWLSIFYGTRYVKKHKTLQLLKGWKSIVVNSGQEKSGKYAKLSVICFCLAIIIVYCASQNLMSSVAGFFVAGALLLTGSYYFFANYWQQKSSTQLSYFSFVRKNLSLYRERSLLLFLLFAFSSFLLVAVVANKNDFSGVDTSDKNSGTGGFSLQAQASFPLNQDIRTREGREKLGFTAEDETSMAGSSISPALFFKGQDISCLNLAKVVVPNIVGVSDSFIKRGGFSVSGTTSQNPWELLHHDMDDGSIPVFGDANSVMWSLYSGLGKTIEIETATGKIKLRFVGLLHNSIFASEIVMSEKHFRTLFPHVSLPTYYFIEAKDISLVQKTLQKTLGELGVAVRETNEILNSFIAVQNTYLLAFTNLGGLGIFLGVFGLAIVIVYSFIQRQGELSLLMSLGMSVSRIRGILFWEVSITAVCGLVCGSISALVAVYPQIISSRSVVDWYMLLYIIAGLFSFTLCLAFVTLRTIIDQQLANVLKKEVA
ncbi:ABC transporter permease [Candidatus Uabimicrobium amorphum]|uniref:ABC transporter permease n=1 Tax=Uabimicrobium amorphum TaxID=2596890 RepID=A0A5S9IX87_UABAM|nr:ABC transporter permease [Candidatus Uabimicrobium amorphum]BBM88195.1 ABC transporter permease [Candidatus Uabimicrobium amorphum]